MTKRNAAARGRREIPAVECAGENAAVGSGSVETVVGIGAVMSTTSAASTTSTVHIAWCQSVSHAQGSVVIQRARLENGGKGDTQAYERV